MKGKLVASLANARECLKTNIHWRFLSYILSVTVTFAVFIMPCVFNFNGFEFLFIGMGSECARVANKQAQSFSPGTDRQISDRALLFGFLACLILFWAGALFVAFHFNPANHPTRLISGVLALAWLACIYPGYRWWRAQQQIAPGSAQPA